MDSTCGERPLDKLGGYCISICGGCNVLAPLAGAIHTYTHRRLALHSLLCDLPRNSSDIDDPFNGSHIRKDGQEQYCPDSSTRDESNGQYHDTFWTSQQPGFKL